MTAEELWDQLMAYVIQRTTALDIETAIAVVNGDPREKLLLVGRMTELEAITEWLDPVRLGVGEN